MSRNGVRSGASEDEVAARVAAQTMARRGIDYVAEVRRLIDAAFTVIERNGTTARVRVADIVAEAGLSNDAFYRHFASKDALVATLVEDGAVRLAGYVAHQMAKESSPEGELKRWIQGVMSQASSSTAATTLAVLWNGSHFDAAAAPGTHHTIAPLAALLHEPLAALGSRSVEFDAALVAHAVVGAMSAHLWARTEPTRREIDHITQFCTAAVAGRAARKP